MKICFHCYHTKTENRHSSQNAGEVQLNALNVRGTGGGWREHDPEVTLPSPLFTAPEAIWRSFAFSQILHSLKPCRGDHQTVYLIEVLRGSISKARLHTPLGGIAVFSCWSRSSGKMQMSVISNDNESKLLLRVVCGRFPVGDREPRKTLL